MLALALALVLAQADTPSVAKAPQPSVAASDTPKGAPGSDYDFVAWCHGALTGHMALYTVVKPELVSIEQPGEMAVDEKNDGLQMAAGRDYLALYTRALTNVDRGRNAALLARRKAAAAQGSAIWDPYRDAAPRQRMWAWVGWDLPGRCETAARKMLTPAGRSAALKAPSPGIAPSSIDEALGAPAAAPDPNAAPPTGSASTPTLRGPQ